MKFVCRVESHISHLRTKSEEELNRLLSMVVDVDNMYIAMNREENPDTKKPYSYLFKVGKKIVENNNCELSYSSCEDAFSHSIHQLSRALLVNRLSNLHPFRKQSTI